MLPWRCSPLCNSKEAIFIHVSCAVSKATWCHPEIPAKVKGGASDVILTLQRELPAHMLLHNGYPVKSKIHAILFSTLPAQCWHVCCYLLASVVLFSAQQNINFYWSWFLQLTLSVWLIPAVNDHLHCFFFLIIYVIAGSAQSLNSSVTRNVVYHLSVVPHSSQFSWL